MNKSAASAASPHYVKLQAVIKSAASAASLRGGRDSGRLDHGRFLAICGRASGQKIVKISDSVMIFRLTMFCVLKVRTLHALAIFGERQERACRKLEGICNGSAQG